MVIKKGRVTKVLGYTFVVFGAMCLARVPTTNSKYVTESRRNNDYLSYSTSYIHPSITGGPRVFPNSTSHELHKVCDNDGNNCNYDGTIDITFSIPKNTQNGITNTSSDYYTFKPSDNCKITHFSAGNRPLVDLNASGLNYGYGVSYDWYADNNNGTDMNFRINCKNDDSTGSPGSDIGILGVKVINSQQIYKTNAAISIYEKVNEESPFYYGKYSGSFEASSGDSQEIIESTKEIKNDDELFENFIEWIVKYAHTQMGNVADKSKTTLIKQYIIDRVTDDNKGSTDYTGYINGNKVLPEIQGIKRITNTANGTITFTIEENLIGYIRTYNYYKNISNPSKNQTFELYFSLPIDQDHKKEIDDIFMDYIKTYVIADTPENENYLNFLKDKSYAILHDNSNNIEGLLKIANENAISISSITNLKNTIDNYYNNKFEIERNKDSIIDFQSAFREKLTVHTLVDDMQNKNMVMKGRIDGLSIMEYANKDYSDNINYNIDRYIIYNSLNSNDTKNRYLLVKITNASETSMKVYFSDFESAIKENDLDKIFTYDYTKDEIYFNIGVQGKGTNPENYGTAMLYHNKALEVERMINDYMVSKAGTDNEYSIGEKPELSSPGDNVYFYEYKYKFVPKTATASIQDDEDKLNNVVLDMESSISQNAVQEATDSVSLTGDSTIFGITNPNSEIDRNINMNSSNELNDKMNIQGIDKQDAEVSEYSNDKQQELAETEKDAKSEEVVLDKDKQKDSDVTNKSGEDKVTVDDSLTITDDEAQLVS